MSDYGFKSFEKAFNKAVPSYDETKYYFIPKRKKYEGTVLHFIHGGKLYKIHMYLSEYEIERWAAHLEEFCATGEFDFHVYHIVYKSIGKDSNGFPKSVRYGSEVFKHPLIVEFGTLRPDQSVWGDFMKNYRAKHGDCGFTQVGKDHK